MSAARVRTHEPVLVEAVLTLLDPRPGEVILDGTLGSGGHAAAILKRLGGRGRLIGLDQDPEALGRARENLKAFRNVEFIHQNFRRLDEVLTAINLSQVDAVLLDIGVSTEQLEEPERGFSFLREGPLDMRMDPKARFRARDFVNDLSQGQLEALLRRDGEERWSRRIARAICEARQKRPIETTVELADLITRAVPGFSRYGARHPATRVFQALRIAVNQEREALEEALPKGFRALRRGGKMAVITFHSVEDRIVKEAFRGWARTGSAELLNRKPIRPSEEEVGRNPRARSAKLRGLLKGKRELK